MIPPQPQCERKAWTAGCFSTSGCGVNFSIRMATPCGGRAETSASCCDARKDQRHFWPNETFDEIGRRGGGVNWAAREGGPGGVADRLAELLLVTPDTDLQSAQELVALFRELKLRR